MKHRMWVWFVAMASMLAVPAAARADFSVLEFPQYAQDNAIDWLFQILSGILLLFVDVFAGLLGLGTTTG